MLSLRCCGWKAALEWSSSLAWAYRGRSHVLEISGAPACLQYNLVKWFGFFEKFHLSKGLLSKACFTKGYVMDTFLYRWALNLVPRTGLSTMLNQKVGYIKRLPIFRFS